MLGKILGSASHDILKVLVARNESTCCPKSCCAVAKPKKPAWICEGVMFARRLLTNSPWNLLQDGEPRRELFSGKDKNVPENKSSLADPCEDIRKTKLDILCKVAVVTGGGSGIGYAAAYELLNNGAKNVVLAHPDQKKGQRAAECLCAQFGMNKALYYPCDIQNSKQFEDVFVSLKNSCLDVDILLNNAGVLDDKNWENSLNINVIGTLRGMLLALKYMKGRNTVVINTCATAGLSPWANCPIFAASKHAIVTASRCFGHSFHYDKTNIRVMGLCPNFTNTPTWEKGVKNHLESEWGKATLESISRIKMQSAALVGRAMVHLIKYGKSGKIYVCDQGILHRAAFPREEDILLQQTVS